MREDVEEVRRGGLDESAGHEGSDGFALQEFLKALLGIAVVSGADEPGDIRP